MDNIKIRNGFAYEKFLSVPSTIKEWIADEIFPTENFISHIGYFPNAKYHFRQWAEGCPDNILFYCTKGKGYYRIGNQQFELNAGQYTIIPQSSKLISYWADMDTPWTIYWVHFTGVSIGAFNASMNILENNGSISIPYNSEGIEIWNKMYNTLTNGYTRDNIVSSNLCLNYFIRTFLFCNTDEALVCKEDSIIEESINFMKENLGTKITLNSLAQRHKISPSHFSKIFVQSRSMAPIDYLIHLKMQEACKLLVTTNMLVKEIANTLGYEDAHYFSRLFKNNNSLSPELYRKHMREIQQ